MNTPGPTVRRSVADLRAIADDPTGALRLTRSAVHARADPLEESAPFLSDVERRIVDGSARGLLYVAGSRPIGIALWGEPLATGLMVEVMYLEPEARSAAAYIDFYRAVGAASGPIAFAPGRLAGLPETEEERVMRALGFERFARSEMRLPREAELPPTSDALTLRTVAPADAPPLARLLDRAYVHQLDRYLFQIDSDPQRDAELQIREIFDGRWGEFLPEASFVVPGPRGLDASTLVVRASYGPLIAQVMVDPDRQGQGLGRAVLVATVRALRARDESPIVLNVTEGNARAIRLYERVGFVRSLGPSHGWYSPERVPVGRAARA
ncbi:MAG TPA: GNAT family N-acetyltransferase [Thermoplasmata archaeon]|nr:GNAT family N-acetyltransferase [Thermoplasmata archaeon]